MSRARDLTMAGVLAALAGIAACDTGSYIYSAEPFDTCHDCMQLGVAIDVIAGSGSTFGCGPTCLVYDSPDAAQSIYVTNQCGPTPPGYTAETQAQAGGAGDPCGAAIAAFLEGGTCSLAGDGGDAGGAESCGPVADAGPVASFD